MVTLSTSQGPEPGAGHSAGTMQLSPWGPEPPTVASLPFSTQVSLLLLPRDGTHPMGHQQPQGPGDRPATRLPVASPDGSPQGSWRATRRGRLGSQGSRQQVSLGRHLSPFHSPALAPETGLEPHTCPPGDMWWMLLVPGRHRGQGSRPLLRAQDVPQNGTPCRTPKTAQSPFPERMAYHLRWSPHLSAWQAGTPGHHQPASLGQGAASSQLCKGHPGLLGGGLSAASGGGWDGCVPVGEADTRGGHP